jgi:hypothetical protein
MHTFYLRHMYIRNELREPCSITLAGEAIDLSEVDTPIYFISTVEDHIAPWKSTYAGARLFKGPVRFVLGGSGHIAGIVNPPASNKYWFWTNPSLDGDADSWLESAEKHPGSWWNDWRDWIAGFGGGKVAARTPGDAGLKVLEDAPGSFAKFRLDAQPHTAPGSHPAGAQTQMRQPSQTKESVQDNPVQAELLRDKPVTDKKTRARAKKTSQATKAAAKPRKSAQRNTKTLASKNPKQ